MSAMSKLRANPTAMSTYSAPTAVPESTACVISPPQLLCLTMRIIRHYASLGKRSARKNSAKAHPRRIGAGDAGCEVQCAGAQSGLQAGPDNFFGEAAHLIHPLRVAPGDELQAAMAHTDLAQPLEW